MEITSRFPFSLSNTQILESNKLLISIELLQTYFNFYTRIYFVFAYLSCAALFIIFIRRQLLYVVFSKE